MIQTDIWTALAEWRRSTSVGLLWTILATALCVNALSFPAADRTTDRTSDVLLEPRTITKTVRILGVGSSSTVGQGSSPPDGYRLELRRLLEESDHNATFTGPYCSGAMKGSNHAGVGGDTIAQIKNRAIADSGWKRFAPNVVLIHAGSNNCNTDGSMKEDAAAEMKALIDTVRQTPNVVVLVSLLHKTQQAQKNECIVRLGVIITNIVATYDQSKVRTVDHFGKLNLTSGDYADAIHVNNRGYVKMAQMWYDAMLDSRVNMSPPSTTADTPTCELKNSNECEKSEAKITKFRIQNGTGWDDGSYQHKSQELGKVINGLQDHKSTEKKIRWADLNGDGQDDYTFILRNTDKDTVSTYQATLNVKMSITTDGNPQWSTGLYSSQLKEFCTEAEQLRWGDVDGDGRDDMICITPQGGLRAARNLGEVTGPGKPSWGDFVTIRDPVAGYSQANVLLGDIDGDGRVDLLLVDSNQEVVGFRNGGPTPGWPTMWQSLGNVFHGSGNGKPSNWKLVDLNGDGRDDWLILSDETGAVTTWINHRGHTRGSLRPVWKNMGQTHSGAQGVDGTITPDRVTFPRSGLSGSRKADYAVVDADGNVTMWKNIGAGGTQLKGDGVRYCDMFGRGTDDYVWIYDNGKMVMWGNTGKPGVWDPPVVITEGKNAQATGITRDYIILADLTGNEKCDILHVSKDGSVRMFENDLAPGRYNWIDRGTVFRGWNIGNCDIRGVRFADLNGDGKMDYICLDPDASARIWLNPGKVGEAPKAGTWINMGTTKPVNGKERENIRFADINGDGLWDYLWVDKFTGAVDSWTNDGQPASGQPWKWTSRGRTSSGVAPGACVQFANVNANGGKRADYVDITPETAEAFAYYNECPA